jgi:DNA-binding SARP family transcriptional activator
MSGSATAPSAETTPRRRRPARSAEPVGPVGQRYADVVALPTWTVGAPQVLAARPGPVELHLLGGFRLLIDGDLVPIGRTGQRMLALLACRGCPATRGQVAHALWPDAASDRAYANLRNGLYRLYRRGAGTVHATPAYLRLGDGTSVDLEHSSRLARQVLSGDAPDDRALLTDALAANLDDDLLPDWDEEWLADHQYRYRQLRLTALETLSTRLTAAGRYGAAVQAALSAVQADRLRDSAHEALIRACLAQGNWHEAFTHYTSYRRILRDELGLEPPASIGRLLSTG